MGKVKCRELVWWFLMNEIALWSSIELVSQWFFNFWCCFCICWNSGIIVERSSWVSVGKSVWSRSADYRKHPCHPERNLVWKYNWRYVRCSRYFWVDSDCSEFCFCNIGWVLFRKHSEQCSQTPFRSLWDNFLRWKIKVQQRLLEPPKPEISRELDE